MRNKFFILIMILFYIVSCDNKKGILLNHLEDIGKKNICKIDKSNWIIKHYYEDKNITEYHIYKNDSDTIVNFSFRYDKLLESYNNIDYSKFFYNKEDSLFYSVQLDSDGLTPY